MKNLPANPFSSDNDNIVPDPNNEFAHYPKALEKMGNIHEFFDLYFLLNLGKLVIYFLAMPLSLPDYSADAIALHLILSAAEIFCLLASSYRGIFIKNYSKSRLASFGMILTELVFIFMNARPFSVFTHYFAIGSIGLTISAIKKLNAVEKLSNLKGYPLFSEILDNPNCLPTNLPFNYLPKNAMKNTMAKQLANTINAYQQQNATMDSIQPPSNIPDDFKDEPFKKGAAAVKRNFPDKSQKEENTVIPPAWCTPSESRLLGNANISSTYNMTEEIFETPKTKINLSKDKKVNLSKNNKINLSKDKKGN